MKNIFMFVVALAVAAVPAFASSIQPVPEPVSMTLLATGLGGIALARRFRRK